MIKPMLVSVRAWARALSLQMPRRSGWTQKFSKPSAASNLQRLELSLHALWGTNRSHSMDSLTITSRKANYVMIMRHVILWTSFVLPLAGCAGTQNGHLFNMKTGQASTLKMGSPQYSNGNVKGSLPDGSTCEGQFSSVSVENAKSVSSVSPMLTENSVASVALMNCGAGRVLKCTLARREWEQFSYGECQDQQGTSYSLIF